MTLYIVEGYKMAEGTATVQFLNQPPMEVNGVFLYRPDKNLWYMAPTREYPWGASFSPNEIKEIREEKKA